MNILVIGGPIGPADIPALCLRARALLECSDAGPILCDVGSVIDPDAAVVDALARVQLAAKRRGRQVRLLHAGRDLQELLVLMGLRDVLPLCDELGVEPRGETEEREHPRGVEEKADPGDLAL